jgi:PrcB C-terminal
MNTAWFQGLLVLGLVLCGCHLSAGSRSADPALEVRLLHRGTNCGGSAASPQATWIADRDHFQEVYRRLKGAVIGGDAARIPAVDFSSEALILVEMGRKTTGGYFLELKSTKARVLDDSAQVELVWGVPAPSDMVTQVLTSPCILIALPRNGSYSRVQILDQNGRVRLTVAATMD